MVLFRSDFHYLFRVEQRVAANIKFLAFGDDFVGVVRQVHCGADRFDRVPANENAAVHDLAAL